MIAGISVAVLLAGCATTPRQPGSPAARQPGTWSLPALPDIDDSIALGDSSGAIRLDAALPWSEKGAAPRIDGLAALHGPAGMFDAQSHLRFDAGDAAAVGQRTGRDADERPAGYLGRQLSEQRLDSRIPVLPDAPLRLSLRQQSTRQWAADGASNQENQLAELDWVPGPTNIALQWTSAEKSGAAPALLDCPLVGRIGLIEPASAVDLQLQTRSCTVTAQRAPGISDAQSWSATYRRIDATNAATIVSWRAIDLLSTADDAPDASGPAYEFKLSRKQVIGDWLAQTAVAMQRSATDARSASRRQWSADTSLRRRIARVALAARLRSGVADDWFLPGGAARSRSMALDLDFSRWATTVLPWRDVALSLSWQWTRADSAPADVGINGRLSIAL